MSPRIVDSLNGAFHRAMRDHPEMLVMGEDILDPYGGAFKVTRGLSDAFPGRVLATPISEAAIVGVGTGLALQGFRPVVEIMFGDFVTLIADQLINHASKIRWMYGQSIDLPLVVRTPMGGRRGYGATHSQSLERLFLGVPGLSVVAVSPLCDPGELLREAIRGSGPVLFIESKALYSRACLNNESQVAGMTASPEEGPFPTRRLAHGPEPDVTLVTYGGMVPLALEACENLHKNEGLACELIVPHRLAPLDIGPIAASAGRSRRLVIVEEGTLSWGWGAEVVARLSHVRWEAPPQRVAAKEFPIPAARSIEDAILPQVADIVAAAVRTVDETLV
jgi:pyruvate/2-oxoglutarate/acetoin dehydrogenase E1 component